MSDVFILGAGFSKAVSADMPLLSDLSAEVRRRLPQLESVAAMFPDDVEAWLTFLSQKHPWLSEATNMRNRALLLDACDIIQHVLLERMERPLSMERPGWLSELVEYWNGNCWPILTLNYDTLVERCVCEVSEVRRAVTTLGVSTREAVCTKLYSIPLTPVWQRSPGRGLDPEEPHALLSLYKLHGSINWYWSGAADSSDETLYFKPATVWGPNDPSESRSAGTHIDKVPFIVPPLTDKLPYFGNTAIRSLWAQAGDALRSATRIFCMGYSSPRTDATMRFFLQSNAPTAAVPFYVVNTPSPRDPDLTARFHTLLDSRYRLNTNYVFEIDPIPRLVEDLIHGSLRA